MNRMLTHRPPEIDEAASGSRCCVEIGGVSLGLNGGDLNTLRLARDLALFQTTKPACDIEIEVAWSDQIHPATGKKLFDSGSLWSVVACDRGLTFDFVTPVLGEFPYKTVSVNPEFSRAEIYLNRSRLDDRQPVYPLEYPVDELLVTHWLTRGRGLEVHACGLVDAVTGSQLFLGHSGAGKSTTTGLWASARDVRVLSDDRIILRSRDNAIWMYGTPWHGDAGLASPSSAKISRIFVLQHGDKNQLTELSRPQAAAELFARCFVPFYDTAALEFALAYVDRVADSVPCYAYKFRPERSAVQRILEFNG